MSKISIALCTYNGAKFLPEQLASIAAQTRQPDELVVCDDGSTDATVQIVEEFAAQAAFPVRLFVNKNNLGTVKNFEQAILLCENDLIFLCDQDDFWLPQKLEIIEREFEKDEKIGLVFSDAELVNENLEPLGVNLWEKTFAPDEREQTRNGKLLEVLLKRNVLTGATAAFRRSLRDLFIPIPTEIPYIIHDGWLALVIAANADISIIEKPLVKYRQHANQQIGVNWLLPEEEPQAERAEAYMKSISQHNFEIGRVSNIQDKIRELPYFQKSLTKIDRRLTERIERVRENIKHCEMRKDLPPNKTARLVPIFKEILSGRYHRFSKGFLSAAKDLTETLETK